MEYDMSRSWYGICAIPLNFKILNQLKTKSVWNKFFVYWKIKLKFPVIHLLDIIL